MHKQKEKFRTIFETALDWADGTLRLLDWLAEAQGIFSEKCRNNLPLVW